MDPAERNRRLIEELAAEGSLKAPGLREALERAPRHLFLSSFYARVGESEVLVDPRAPGWSGAAIELAYQNAAIATRKDPAAGRAWTSSCSQPSIVCRMLAVLEVQEGMSILEVGAGTGWNAALLAALAGETGSVSTVDCQADVAEEAGRHLAQAGFPQAAVRCADGTQGWADRAPFDRIVCTAATPDVYPAWTRQLKPGGRILVPFEVPGLASPLLIVDARPEGWRARFAGHSEFMRLQGTPPAPGGAGPGEPSGGGPEMGRLMEQAPSALAPVPWEADRDRDDWYERIRLLFYLILTDPRAVSVRCGATSWESRVGLWDRGAGWLVLIGPEHTDVWGPPSALDDLMGRYEAWKKMGRPSLEDYSFHLIPSGEPRAAGPLPPGALGALRRPHATLIAFPPPQIL